jgi:alpha-tubulin suppressor-like RCC1 family protein
MIKLTKLQLIILFYLVFITMTVPVYASSQKFIAISTEGVHTLALAYDGSVWTWGNMSTEASIPFGNQTASIQKVPISDVVAIAAGYDHSLALKSDGTVWAWGFNDYGQLGDGTTETRYAPVQVIDLDNVTEISAGIYYSVALKSNGTVWTWGCNQAQNNDGVLGDGTRETRLTPVQVKGLTNVTKIMGQYFAIKDDGTVWAWGDVLNMSNSTMPFQVPDLKNIKAIDMDTSYGHALFIKDDGTVWAWGNNADGEFGNGTFTRGTQYIPNPVQVNSLTNVKAISAGFGTSMALKNDGTVWVWGQNGNGQLGIGTIRDIELTPVKIQGLNGVVAISTKYMDSAFLKDDGSIWMCGDNSAGQLGDNSIIGAYITVDPDTGVSYSDKPIQILGPSTSATSTVNTLNSTSDTQSPTMTFTNNTSTINNAITTQTQNSGLLDIVIILCVLIVIGACVIYFGAIRKL